MDELVYVPTGSTEDQREIVYNQLVADRYVVANGGAVLQPLVVEHEYYVSRLRGRGGGNIN